MHHNDKADSMTFSTHNELLVSLNVTHFRSICSILHLNYIVTNHFCKYVIELPHFSNGRDGFYIIQKNRLWLIGKYFCALQRLLCQSCPFVLKFMVPSLCVQTLSYLLNKITQCISEI